MSNAISSIRQQGVWEAEWRDEHLYRLLQLAERLVGPEKAARTAVRWALHHRVNEIPDLKYIEMYLDYYEKRADILATLPELARVVEVGPPA